MQDTKMIVATYEDGELINKVVVNEWEGIIDLLRTYHNLTKNFVDGLLAIEDYKKKRQYMILDYTQKNDEQVLKVYKKV